MMQDDHTPNINPIFALIDHLQRNTSKFASNVRRHVEPILSQPRSATKPIIANKRAPQLLASLSASSSSEFLGKEPTQINREDVGRATWTFLHALAAQYPEKPTRQQQRDVKQLMDILTRMYPCRECAEHFADVIKTHPPRVCSHHEFELWMCNIHNVVNRSIGKPTFNCELVSARWGALDCDENACTLDWSKRN